MGEDGGVCVTLLLDDYPLRLRLDELYSDQRNCVRQCI